MNGEMCRATTTICNREHSTCLVFELLNLFTMLCANVLQDKVFADKHLGAESVAPPAANAGKVMKTAQAHSKKNAPCSAEGRAWIATVKAQSEKVLTNLTAAGTNI